ncbi:MAG: hypothetical protein HY319_17095 [Armatimonadetes bacterium]|nr:hypothetical protein [Armatimonadota bacterium]
MDQLLQGLRREGYFDSGGQFTLDPRRARELLRDFQLGSPHHYVLHLVSFAFGEGAPAIRLQVTERQVRLEAEGIRLDRDTVRNPLSGLFSRSAGRARIELAIGINSALGLPGATVRLSSSDRAEGWVGRYDQDRFLLEDASAMSPPEASVVIQVDRQADPQLPEARAVREFFRFCPVPVEVNGETISGPVPLETGRSHFWLQAVPETPATRLAFDGPVDWSVEHRARFSALVEWGDRDELSFVLLGRLYRASLPWRLAGTDLRLRIVVATDRLDRDLSQMQLVENAVYHNLLELFRTELFSAVASFATACGTLAPDRVYRCYDLVEYLADAAARAGWFQEAYRLQYRLMEVAQTEDRWRYAAALGRMALLAERMADAAAARQLREQARQVTASLQGEGTVFREGEEVPALLYFAWRSARSAQTVLGPAQPLAAHSELTRIAAEAERVDCPRLAEACFRLLLQNDSTCSPMLLSWARVLLRLGRWDEAARILERSRPTEGAYSWDLEAQRREMAGVVAAEQGRLKEANRQLAGALELKRLHLGDYSLELGLILERLAHLSDHLGERGNARHYRRWAAMLHVKS